MKIEELVSNPLNPRKISDDQLSSLKKSYETFGPLHGFIYNRSTNRLVGGHQTKKVIPPDAQVTILKRFDTPTEKGTVAFGYVEYGNEIIPYREVLVDEPTEMAMNLAANKHGGDWDFALLPDAITLIDSANLDLSLTGFSPEELSDIMAPVRAPIEGEDEVPEPPKEAKTKLGDLYLLGDHRLLCGDSTDINQVEKLMNGEKADMAFTSPPYNAGYIDCNIGINGKKYLHDDDIKPDFDKFLNSIIRCWIDRAKFIWINIQMLSGNTDAIINWLYENKNYLCDVVVWTKTNPPPSINDNVMTHGHEQIFIFSKDKKGRVSGEFKKGSLVNTFQSSVGGDTSLSGIHHATFSVGMVENFLNSSKTVIDPFGGSGSTLIACEKTKRKCFMMEIDPIYCDVIVSRWEKFTGQKAVLST